MCQGSTCTESQFWQDSSWESHSISSGAFLSSCRTSLFLALRSIWMNLRNCRVVATLEVSVLTLWLSKAFR